MKPEEKANELYNKYFWTQYPIVGITRSKIAKQCTLICVGEIISLRVMNNLKDYENNPHHYYSKEYWQEVKSIIKKL